MKRFYIVFIILNTIDGGLIYAFFPETKGKLARASTRLVLLMCWRCSIGLTLEEMAEVFGDPVEAVNLGTPTNEKTLGPETHSIRYAEKV